MRPDGAPTGWLARGDDAVPALRVAIDAAIPRAGAGALDTGVPAPVAPFPELAVALIAAGLTETST